MQEIFDYFIEKLNDNDDSLLYEGNYVFRMYNDKLQVLTPVTGTLVSESLDFTPVSVTTKQPIPFVENNKRVDWLIEFGLLVRMDGDEYDPATDKDYANIQSVMDDMQSEVYDNEGIRYTFKTQDPNYQGYSFLGKSKVAIISCVFNVTEISFGYFSQESVFVLGSKTLDITNFTINATRRFYTADKKDTTNNDYNMPTGRAMVFELTFNYKDELDLLKEVYGTQILSKSYTLVHTFNSIAYSYTVVAESGNEVGVTGGVKKLTIRLVEVL